MFKDSFRHRKKFYVTLLTSVYVLIFAICSLVIAANWKYVKLLFAPKEKIISVEQQQYEELFLKVKYLEELSKEYDESNYQLRAIIYIRSAQYPDEQWGGLLGENDEAFENYVKTNQGDKNISLLKVLGPGYKFTNPSTKQKVDFYKMFATLNALHTENQACIDFWVYGKYISEVAASFKNVDSTGETLRSIVKSSMMSTGSLGEYDRIPAYDAVNIYNEFANNTFANESIYVSSMLYYSTMTKESEIKDFKEHVGIDDANPLLVNEIYGKLQSNIYVQEYSDLIGFDFPDFGEEGTREEEVYKTCIKVYLDILKV